MGAAASGNIRGTLGMRCRDRATRRMQSCFVRRPKPLKTGGIFLGVAFFEAGRIGLADGRNIARRGDTERLPDNGLLGHRKLCPSRVSSAVSKCARA